MIKQPHNLFGLTGPDDFHARLDEHCLKLRDLISEVIDPSAEHAVLLGGSLAEGYGNAASDIDLVLLVEDASSLSMSRDVFSVQLDRAQDTLIYRNGIEFNIEVFDRRGAEKLARALVDLVPVITGDRSVRKLPVLQPCDLRFLHRLRAGWVLHGDSIVATWRDELMVEMLPTYLSIRHLNEFHELFEDAQAMLSADPRSARYVGRMAIEALCLSMSAHFGHTSRSKKWLLRWIDQVRDQSAKRLLEQGVDLILQGETASDAATMLSDIGRLSRHMIARMSQDESFEKGAAYLAEAVVYVALPATDPST